MIEVKWEILEEEGRTIKTICTLANIPCKFIPKTTHYSHPNSKDSNILETIEDLRKIASKVKEIQQFFGSNAQQKQMVDNLLVIYNKNLRQLLCIPIIHYYQTHHPPLPQEMLQDKYKSLVRGLKNVEIIVANKKGKFICGDDLTVIDLIFFFDLCNLFYFKKNPSMFPKLGQWFGQIYNMKDVKSMVHQWFSMAKQILRSMRKRRAKAHL